MSFGFPKRVKAIDKALSAAEQRGVVMLAAASNCGANDRRSWPARDDRVLCIYATTGIGNKYPRNPTPVPHRDNFAVLGTSVEALWPRQAALARRSGTSTATALCAAIVATVIAVLRSAEGKYVATRRIHMPAHKADPRGEYRDKLEALGKASNMANVLRRMVELRDGYQYITPWTVFSSEGSLTSIIDGILEAIDA